MLKRTRGTNRVIGDGPEAASLAASPTSAVNPSSRRSWPVSEDGVPAREWALDPGAGHGAARQARRARAAHSAGGRPSASQGPIISRRCVRRKAEVAAVKVAARCGCATGRSTASPAPPGGEARSHCRDRAPAGSPAGHLARVLAQPRGGCRSLARTPERAAPLLFQDEELNQQRQQRDAVAPAQPSSSARRKKSSRRSSEGLPLHSFKTLLAELAKRCHNTCRAKGDPAKPLHHPHRPEPAAGAGSQASGTVARNSTLAMSTSPCPSNRSSAPKGGTSA